MPLLTLLETVPKINNNETHVKAVQKKASDFEQKLEKLEGQINFSKN